MSPYVTDSEGYGRLSMKPPCLHYFQTNGKRFQCKYCEAFNGETIAERDERQAKEARNG